MKKILVLGATGSIGTNTLSIVRNMPEDFSICGISAHRNIKSLINLAQEFSCQYTLTSDEGENGIKSIIEKTHPDIVVNGISGAAGLSASKLTVEAGIDIALANKETVVTAWSLIKKLAQKTGSKIIPVDSEHSAIFSLIEQIGKENIDEIIITASGGPFRILASEKLETVTLEEALKHPTWNMGKKITIDSATLANKGLEVIEAVKLFEFNVENIKVVVHPQSLIHSLVRTKDGILYAQISEPDMKYPILSALNWPEKKENNFNKFDLFDKNMTFFRPRIKDFPMLEYAFEAAKNEKSYAIAYNAANEEAVKAFIEKKISFKNISLIVRTVLDKDWTLTPDSFDDVFFQDEKARKLAQELI